MDVKKTAKHFKWEFWLNWKTLRHNPFFYVQLECSTTVVYFDQPTLACACICMVQNNENCQKSTSFIVCRRGSCKVYVEKPKKKFQMSNQRLGVNQPLLSTIEKYFFYNFWVFYIVFNHAKTYAGMHSLTGQNAQQTTHFGELKRLNVDSWVYTQSNKTNKSIIIFSNPILVIQL